MHPKLSWTGIDESTSMTTVTVMSRLCVCVCVSRLCLTCRCRMPEITHDDTYFRHRPTHTCSWTALFPPHDLYDAEDHILTQTMSEQVPSPLRPVAPSRLRRSVTEKTSDTPPPPYETPESNLAFPHKRTISLTSVSSTVGSPVTATAQLLGDRLGWTAGRRRDHHRGIRLRTQQRRAHEATPQGGGSHTCT
jgi:hypothetical protein